MNKFYITTTLPYVNAEPHLGFAMEIVQADIIARYHRLLGDDVIFNTGTDEHGIKIYRAALAQNKDPQTYVDENAAKYDELKKALNLSYTNFIRTSDPNHKKAAQEFWKRCHKNGDIYKKMYKIKYCIGCELEKTDSELVNERCPTHPNFKIEFIEEANYFFKFSRYQEPLLEFYEKNPKFVLPDFRFNEIKKFVKEGLQDFSVSRFKTKMPWGIPVPNDKDHVMFVWFDALINYISTLGWPEDEKIFNESWPGIQVAGKDNLRQQSAMWQAMLMSAGLPNSKQIIIHGFITNAGQKMSKSLGNVIDPFDLVEKYGIDAVRFFIAYELNTFEDSAVTLERIHESYNANLANGLGNLVARVAKLCENANFTLAPYEETKKFNPFVEKYLQKYDFMGAIGWIWRSDVKWGHIWLNQDKVMQDETGINSLKLLDQNLNERKPWELKDRDEKELLLSLYVINLRRIAFNLQPFLPETAEKILKQFSGQIKSAEPLFPRI